jgi:hypothetical protein
LPAPRGFADSKTLSEEKRERLYAAIQAGGDLLGQRADVLSAAFISGAVLCTTRRQRPCRAPFLGRASRQQAAQPCLSSCCVQLPRPGCA